MTTSSHAKSVKSAEAVRMVPPLLAISKATRALLGLKLSELGLHNGQDELILALREAETISVSKLADELHVRPSTASKMLDRLVTTGMAERVNDTKDGRRTLVRITPAGLDARSRILAMRAKLEAELVSSFSEDLEATVDALDTVAGILQTRLRRLR